MNKGIIIALVVGLGFGISFWFTSRPAQAPSSNTQQQTASNLNQAENAVEPNSDNDSAAVVAKNQIKQPDGGNIELPEDEIDEFDEEIKPADQVYGSAAEALEAIKKGAERYDDIVLEQFVNLQNCAWCPELFTGLKELMLAESSSSDLKSYSAEILALSGSVENVEALFKSLETNQGKDDANIFAEAIELSFGDEKLVTFLTEKVKSENSDAKEAAIAALTNHGSPAAFEAMYQATIAANDPDGYYSRGLGIGEMIIDEATIPLATEAAKKNDQYSGLAVKALLNYGTDGLKVVQGIISELDEASVEKLLVDAVDHVSYEDDVKNIATSSLASAKTSAEKKFWEQLLEEIALSEQDELEFEEDLEGEELSDNQ